MIHKLNSNLIAGVFALAAAVAPPARSQTYSILYDFDETPHGCCAGYPGVLAQGRDGNIYGTTLAGGVYGYGSVFVIGPGGGLSTLYSFDITDGLGPQSGLAMGRDGNFYGTTYQGGAHSAGTIFRITPGGSLTILYSFANNGDGAYPRTPPVPAPDGNLYGVSANHAASTLYRITPAGAFTVLATLPAESDAPLTLAADGKLYGTTVLGGTYNQGTVFSITTAGVFKTIYSFNGPTGGSPQGALLQASDGNFYSTASLGGTSSGGVVYRMTPAGAYKVLHNFVALPSTSGSIPTAGLVQGSDGYLYGVTSIGGLNGFGTIFRLKTNGSSYSVVYNFDKTDGATPYSTPMLHTNGIIYGLTQGGGTSDDGVLYAVNEKLTPFVSVFDAPSGRVGTSVEILGQGFSGATGVLFGAGPGTFTATSDTYMTANIVAGATTGSVTVKEAGGNLVSPQTFKIIPTISSFSPASGSVGSSVKIKGMSLLQATAVKFGGAAATVFTVDSNTQVTATVPSGAVTGKISISTPGGTANSSTSFTVN
ncbi:MAG TPA: choice-of-anchor tandem repeat GloVer-containing protein [Bryobacteraceae bacterium]|nr:choice-of-anchor tandem repeat GloVer-containing protein [Bryobacteraceae bacterium]